jgi:hypothetical protein
MAPISQQLESYLNGNQPAPSDAVYSWAAFFVYKKALQILNLPKEKRLKEIEKAPAYLQDRLKTEITRVYKCRV